MMTTIRAAYGVALIALALAGIASGQEIASPLFVSHDPILSICISPGGEEVAFVALSKGRNVLYLRPAQGPETQIDSDSLIRNVQFLDADRLVYATRDQIKLHDRHTGETGALASGANPVCFQGHDRLVYTQGKAIRILKVRAAKDAAVTAGQDVLLPCDWLTKNTFLACKDGCVFKVGLDGSREVILEGNPYAPWYVGVTLSPDGSKALLVSDDTKANVGGGGHSVWVMSLADRTATQLVSGNWHAQWVDSERIVMSSAGRLALMNVVTRAEKTLEEGAKLIETSDCRAGRVVLARRETDEDGLMQGASVSSISVASQELLP